MLPFMPRPPRLPVLRRRNVVLVVLFDGRGQMLPQHRDAAAPANPGRWGLFEGAVEPGESPGEALVREATRNGATRRTPSMIH
jgi:8-oxo-dGTP pyrophosphatase MutT (NUDIX family)